VRHVAGEVPVVRQQEEAFRLDIEASDGLDSSPEIARDQVHHRVALFGIGHGRDEALRLVEKQVRLLGRRAADPPAIQFDGVALRVGAFAELGDAPVDLNASLCDPFLRFAAGCEPCLREDLLDPDRGRRGRVGE